MTAEDRDEWNRRYRSVVGRAEVDIAIPAELADVEDLLPRSGRALDLACGQGAGTVWLAERGLAVTGVDVSPVAVEWARSLAEQHGVSAHCRFEVADLDSGLPDGPHVDLIVCHLFWDPHLATAIADRLVPSGILAIVTLSEVGAHPGRFRAAAGELEAAFDNLDVLAHREAAGHARLVARKP